MAEPTRYIPHNGSWRNSAIIDRQRASQSPYINMPDDTPRPAPLAGLRVLICLLLVPLSILLAASGALAWWTQTTLVDEQGFSSLSNSLAHDSNVQAQLAQAVTADIMASETITSTLGSGNENGLLGTVQNLARSQMQSTVSEAAETLVQSDSYPRYGIR